MIILEGRKLAEKILADLKNEIKCRNLKLKMAVVLAGNNSISKVYVQEKKKTCESVGIDFQLFHFLEDIKEKTLQKEIKKIVHSKDNSGIIIQLPLPKHLLIEGVLNLIPQEKDIDVLSEKSLGKFYQGILPILPPVVCAVGQLL